MSPIDARVLYLANEAERDWSMVTANLRKSQAEEPTEGGPQCAWVALSLDHAYEAFESMLVRFERALSLPERSGSVWHRSLLNDATRPIPGLRPALVPMEALADWTELLAFRHFLRHAYSAELEAPRLRALRARLGDAVRVTETSIHEVLAALRTTG